jgi:hypothetical protein
MILFQVVHTEHVFSVYEFSVIEIGFSVMLKCFLLYLTLFSFLDYCDCLR